jgi:NitT/TauT family transport system substrate-binding protein
MNRTGDALSRRDLLAGAGAAAMIAGCRRQSGSVLRLGFMTNLTHAPAIAGVASGRIEKALGMKVEPRSFRAGPRVVEALIGDAIDAGTAGPSAIVFTHARHGAGALRVLSGCSSGGASFVVAAGSAIAGPSDLRGKTLATPQIGTTQDISLRKYLRLHGYAPRERGGDVNVHALDASTILTEMKRGALDGAWLPEPWATRTVLEAGARRFLDERDLWPEGRFPTALLTSRGTFARERPDLARRLVDALAEEVQRALKAPAETRAIVNDELARSLGKRLPEKLLEEAWPFVDFTSDPLPDALETIATDAADLGLAPRTTCKTLFGS